jgi:ribose 5-phosphate isomerase B
MLASYLELLGYRVVDVGCFGTERVDYPDIAVEVCKQIIGGKCERGIMIDGAGIGSSMACNKVRGIRAALCYDVRTARNSREHNNANVLTLGGPLHTAAELCELVKVWLETRFGGGRHIVRINKIMALERGEL